MYIYKYGSLVGCYHYLAQGNWKLYLNGNFIDSDVSSKPILNDKRQLLYAKGGNLYLYDKTGTREIDRGLENRNGRLNDLGEVAWEAYDGHDWEIFFYSAGKIKQLTDNDYDDTSPQLNNKGQVVWVASAGADKDIFLYRDGIVHQISRHNGYYTAPQINDRGEVVWEGGIGIYRAVPEIKYAFTYSYGNGDAYRGHVYASADYPYQVGYTKTLKNETGQTGTYTITAMSYDGTGSKNGQVFIDSYHDGESNQDFIPMKKGQPAGTNYLGSELDYILKDGVAAYQFGKGYYEADVGDRYVFRYSYDKDNPSAEYYQGVVYRMPGYVYYPGYKLEKKNETGKTGCYEILAMSYTGDTSKYRSGYGEVYVDTYKDGESGKTFAPLHKGQAVGTAFLGSELDYIIASGVDRYKFGQGYWEADE